MKSLNKITSILLLIALFCSMGCPIHAYNFNSQMSVPNASIQYQEVEKLPLVENDIDTSVMCFHVFSDQHIEYISRKLNKKVKKFSHYSSTDGGKTWKKKSMNWATPYLDKLYGNIEMDDKGNLYALYNSGSYDKLLKVTNGTAKVIPNLTFSEEKADFYDVLGVMNNGNIVIKGSLMDQGNYTILSVNPKTGFKQKILKFLNGCFIPFNYANGTLYGAELVNGGLNLNYKNYDLLTGKQILSVPQSIYYKGLKNDIDCVSKDGKAAYFATNDGLFQFNFNTKKFEKLLDGSACTLGDNTAHCRRMDCDQKGNVYILTTYDRDNHAKTYLCKYAPCSAVSEAPLGSKENPYAIEPYDPEPADLQESSSHSSSQTSSLPDDEPVDP